MPGHLFRFATKKQVFAAAQSKTLNISAEQADAGAREIQRDDLVVLTANEADDNLILWAVARARTGFVNVPTSKRYVGLKFVKIKNDRTWYALSLGIATGELFQQTGWKPLDNDEVAACLFDTRVYADHVGRLHMALKRSVPTELAVSPDHVLKTVLCTVAQQGGAVALRRWYEAEVLLNESKYREALKRRLTEIDGHSFEQLINGLFQIQAFGFSTVIVTKQSHDKGVDLFLTQQNGAFGQMVLVAQCKRQAATVGVDEVERLRLSMNRAKPKASRGIFVTTSHFSKSARDFALDDGQIHLIDGEGLADLFFRYADQTPGLWKILGRSNSQLVFTF